VVFLSISTGSQFKQSGKRLQKKIFHLKATVLGSVAAAGIRLHLGSDPVSPEPGQSPVNGASLRHQDVHGLSQEQSHNHQECRQRGVL